MALRSQVVADYYSVRKIQQQRFRGSVNCCHDESKHKHFHDERVVVYVQYERKSF